MDKEVIYTYIYICIYINTHTYTHTHNGIIVIKDDFFFSICNSMGQLEGIMLGEISQRKTNTVCYQLYVESQK